MTAAIIEAIGVVEQGASRLPIQQTAHAPGGRASSVRAGHPGRRSQMAGAPVAKEMTVDDSHGRRHVPADELPRGQG
jgi:hypothetical protein